MFINKVLSREVIEQFSKIRKREESAHERNEELVKKINGKNTKTDNESKTPQEKGVSKEKEVKTIHNTE